MAVQYGFCHIMVIIDTIFTYLTLSTYLQYGSTSARVAQYLTSETPFLYFTLKLHSLSLFFIKIIILHAHWLSPLQKVSLHSSK